MWIPGCAALPLCQHHTLSPRKIAYFASRSKNKTIQKPHAQPWFENMQVHGWRDFPRKSIRIGKVAGHFDIRSMCLRRR
jgi:hypothetical protein